MTAVHEANLKKPPTLVLTMGNQNFCPIKFWVLVSMCCSIIQLKQLTVHYRGLGSNAQEHAVEGGKGAGLSLGVAAHSPIDLSAT